MATNGQLMQQALASVTQTIATVLASPLPNVTIDGVTIDRMTYYRGLLEQQKAIIEQMQKAAGPFTVTSVAR